MKRKRDICEKCKYFFNGIGDCCDRKYAFCMNTELHSDSSFYEFLARTNPDNCLEEDFFEQEYGEEIFSECPFKAEQLMEDWNEKKD